MPTRKNVAEFYELIEFAIEKGYEDNDELFERLEGFNPHYESGSYEIPADEIQDYLRSGDYEMLSLLTEFYGNKKIITWITD